ncbi:PI-PLC X domain-containing protein At5g67130-like [Oryza brachyantha]|uniref:Phosphatidylinositol-specific phospholipase C X domain-containing protein n=1 Tax=Oryza brachyantha TaxID=4533 RepID=J3M2Y1_ORYBR|nr:PI-PLC X domain-containing protein At5g67130-like [Oryza brachyantha]
MNHQCNPIQAKPAMGGATLLPLLLAAAAIAAEAEAGALVGDKCEASGCGAGMRCASCSPLPGSGPPVCSRTTPLDPKQHRGTELPFNRYTWLTTHNSFAIVGSASRTGAPIIAPPNQEDSITSQLKNGVRGLMLDAYDFQNDVWLCHSFAGKCYNFAAYQRAVDVLKEIALFLESNPSEVITLFVEDYAARGSVGKVLRASGLSKFVFPPAKMPKDGGDWPLLKDMIADSHRVLVFSSKPGKDGDGMAYEWDYVLETQYGNDGLVGGSCPKRSESRAMDSTKQSLILMNFFSTNPSQLWACGNNSAPLVAKLKTCYDSSANRWPNYIAVDFYMRSRGGGAPLATDVANGRLQCGCDSIAYCKAGSPFGRCALPPKTAATSPAAAPPETDTSIISPAAAPPKTMTPSSPKKVTIALETAVTVRAEEEASTGTSAADGTASSSSSNRLSTSSFLSGSFVPSLLLLISLSYIN